MNRIIIIFFIIVLVLLVVKLCKSRSMENYDEYGPVPDECGWPVEPRGCPPGLIIGDGKCVANIYQNVFYCPLTSVERKGCKLYEDPNSCPLGRSCYLTEKTMGKCVNHNDFMYCCPSNTPKSSKLKSLKNSR